MCPSRFSSIAFFISFFYLSGWAAETVNLADWDTPIYYGTRPILDGDLFYIYDRYDDKLKAYSLANGWASPQSLWEVGSKGDGPGEIPTRSTVHHLAVHPNGQIWISHRLGILVFSKDGQLVRHQKMPYNKSWLVLQKNKIAMTSRNVLRDRSLLTLVRPGVANPLWMVDAIKGIPRTEKGVYLEETQEVYYRDGLFLNYLAILGQLMVIDPQGEIRLLLELPQTLPDYLTPADHTPSLEHGKEGFQYFHLPNGYSGILKDGKRLFVLTLHYCGGVATQKQQFIQEKTEKGYYQPLKILNVVDLKTGEILKKYFHESWLEPSYLLDSSKDILTVFNLDSGDQIVRIPWTELQQVKRILF